MEYYLWTIYSIQKNVIVRYKGILKINNMAPKNWPKNIIYTNKIIDKNILYPINDYIEGVFVKEITQSDHILLGEYGLFTRRQWEKYEIIGEYCGELCEYNENNDKNGYIASLYYDLSPEETIYIDANKYGNETRFINDYRNIKSNPNTQLTSCNISGKQHILIIVIETILPYNEILIDYGGDYWDYHKKSTKNL